MKQQPAKKRTSEKSKASKVSTKSTKGNVKDWRVIGEWYVAIPLAILLVFVVGYLARGWIRYHGEPEVYKWSVDDTNKVLKKQSDDLSNPLKRMGFADMGEATTCSLTYANGFSSELSCGSHYGSYNTAVTSLKPDLVSRAATLQIALQTQGWMGGNTTLSELSSNIQKGIDYTPDATYFKTLGKYTCLLSYTTAFSKPKPPAMAVTMDCTRQYGILGGAQSY
jgi:hypothetical protein